LKTPAAAVVATGIFSSPSPSAHRKPTI